MNLLLLSARELDPMREVVLTDRRARHLLDVLHVSKGQVVRAGVLNKTIGRAEVVSVEGQRVRLRLLEQEPIVEQPDRTLLLAIPRPKVLSRCVEHAAALGFTQIVLFRARRVEKSLLSSHKLTGADIERHLILGLEQGGHAQLPRLSIFTKFRPFVEDELDQLVPTPFRFAAHPEAPSTLSAFPESSFGSNGRFCLAIGPEGGFVPFEIALLAAHGFILFRADVGALRVESALSYFTGQLDVAAQRYALAVASGELAVSAFDD